MSGIPPTPKEAARIKEAQKKIEDVTEILHLVKSGNGSKLCFPEIKTLKPLKHYHGDLLKRNQMFAKALRQIQKESVVDKKQLLERKDVDRYLQEHAMQCSTDLMRIHDFVFQRVDGKIIAREDPESLFQRIDYLKNIKALRAKQNPIVYVGTFEFPRHQIFLPLVTKCVLVISPKYGHIEMPRREFDHGWFVDIMNMVPEKVTFVVEDYVGEDKEEIPNINSTKIEMKSWLNLQCVPFDNKIHKSELYRLVELKKKTILNKIEMIPKTLGCDVILMKKNTSMPNYFDRLVKEIVDEKWATSINTAIEAINTENFHINDTYSFMNTIPQILWKEVEEHVMLEEQKILEEDLIMDNCLDELLRGVKHENFQYDNNYVY